jgi:tRNA threonylcarbamoyladenosine biosynthesis protein TsaE
MKKTINIRQMDDMAKFAKQIAGGIKPGMIIGLKGDLGSGKTTFTQFLAKQLGIQDNVNSPTFTILKIYQGPINLYHMDVYRLETIGYDYELDDFIYGDGVAVIEWYPYIRSMLPKSILEISIEIVNENERIVTIEGSDSYEAIVEAIGH